MRRIPITERIKEFAGDYSREMENENNFKQGNSPKANLFELAKELKEASTIITTPKCRSAKGRILSYEDHKGNEYALLSDYVMAIHDNYDGINALLPSEYRSGILNKIDDILVAYGISDISEVKVKFHKKRIRPFFELVVEAMRYDVVQKKLMPKYIKKLGIKTCVYCNAQFATTACPQEIIIKKKKPTIKDFVVACYELDHNIPKSKRPCLCTNFYNLQPSCSSCNRRKNNRDLGFSVYYEVGDTDTKPIHFVLDPADIIRFRETNKGDGIKPHLCNEGKDTPPPNFDDVTPAGRFNHMLGIQSIYDEYDDVVEEILWKHKIYSSGFMKATITQMKSLCLEGFDLKRFILDGYYDKEEDFLKRPLSIMKNDLWNQLNAVNSG
ncbi:MAG: hypothetical protein F083_2299 [bacterium F083]|nr:MAG: hypothetical protein AUK64_1372 [bacterium P201]KWW38225.1 MAG: hypothetical protein F083_2299 [bacterium F083]